MENPILSLGFLASSRTHYAIFSNLCTDLHLSENLRSLHLSYLSLYQINILYSFSFTSILCTVFIHVTITIVLLIHSRYSKNHTRRNLFGVVQRTGHCSWCNFFNKRKYFHIFKILFRIFIQCAKPIIAHQKGLYSKFYIILSSI
jgi:hypothetical protein